MVVMAPDAAGVVCAAGGWVFDQVMAGWDVDVWLARESDVRPLRILGARAATMDAGLSAVRGPQPRAVAVAAEMYSTDAAVRECVANLLDQGTAEVRLWGDQLPADLDSRFGAVRHHLSVAARAFKAYALAAAAVTTDPAAVETFHGHGLLAPSKTA